MKSDSYLRFLLSDNCSLMKYYRERVTVSLQDVRRSMLLKVRELGYSVPDHYYRLGVEFSFSGVGELGELFTIGLPKLADEYLEIREGHVFVKGERMNEWQLLLPQIPPLLLVTMKIWKESGPIVGDVVDFAYRHLLPSVRNTAIPSAYLPEMKTLKEEKHGFDDLHIHLNGAVETDLAWHDFLCYPEVVYQGICRACHNDKVKEQLEQLTDISAPIEFYHLFCIAGRIREWLFQKIANGKDIFGQGSFENLLYGLVAMRETFKEHPVRPLMGNSASPLILEGLLYVKTLDYLVARPHDAAVAGAFHYYLLILGVCNRLLVQQTDAFGFEQFQKYTSNNFREFSERTYPQRFLQLAGNDLKNINYIEGRFSPKASVEDNMAIINKIVEGYNCLTQSQNTVGVPQASLSLVAHFIKRSERHEGNVRYSRLREDLDKRTDALIALMNTNSSCARLVTGADAAASEFDTPPEVFAPSFRRLREHGLRHFTYHAGEDFFHLLSGLRAIYESMEFLGLRTGDRIGHATAAGVDVRVWKQNVGDSLWMRREEYLDDLVFAYHLIVVMKERMLESLLPKIALRIEDLASKIYPCRYSVRELIEAWLQRKENPVLLKGESSNVSEQIYLYYHSKEGRERGKEICIVDAYEIFGEKELMCIQKLILKLIHQRQIVIETLPTSNVIIGHHHGFSTYHLYNWYRWSKEGVMVPAIVVGTDDAGIFATNIYNEYCHIYCMLVFDKGLSPYEAMEYIERLVHNAKVYCFSEKKR